MPAPFCTACALQRLVRVVAGTRVSDDRIFCFCQGSGGVFRSGACPVGGPQHRPGHGLAFIQANQQVFCKQICDKVLFRWGVCERKKFWADSITLGATLAHAVAPSLVVSCMRAGCMHLVSEISTAPRSSFFWAMEALHSQVAGSIGIFKYSIVTHHDNVCTYLSGGPITSITCTTAIAQPPWLVLP